MRAAQAVRLVTAAGLSGFAAAVLTTDRAALAQTWSVSVPPVLNIGEVESEPPYELSKVGDVLRLPDGRIVVANGASQELRLFDAQGKYIRTIGKKGRGPGEFAEIGGVQLAGRDSLYIFDRQLGRVSIFNTNGAFLTSFQLQATGDQVRPIRMYRLAGVLGNRDLILVAWAFPADMKPTPTLHFDSLATLLYGGSGTLQGEIGEPAGMDMYATPRSTGDVKFGRVSSAFVHGNQLYMTDGGKLEVRVYEAQRGLVRTISGNRAPRPITRADEDGLMNYWVGRAPPARKPEVRKYFEEWPRAKNKPWIGNLVVDNSGHVWAEQYEPFWSKAARTWEVFDPRGRHVASVKMPAGLQVQQVGANFVLGVWKDEFDVEHVRMYGLRRP